MPPQSDRLDEGLAQRVATLEDLEALRTLKHRYAETVDRCVADPSEAALAAILELFADDCKTDYGQFGEFEGRAGLASFFQTVLPSIVSWSLHVVSNPILELAGDRATGSWYGTAYGVFRASPQAGPQPLFVRYEDQFVKTDAGWRFSSVVAVFLQPN